MQYISLSNKSLSYFTTKAPLSELGGSSKYHVFNNEIVIKEKAIPQKIENTTATYDYLNQILNDNMSEEVLNRIKINYIDHLYACEVMDSPSDSDLNRLQALKEVYVRSLSCGSEFPVKYALVQERILQSQSRYQHSVKPKITSYRINKSKVRQKMFALFNLQCSKKFIAFFSVSFPVGSSDDSCFVCWDYWLSCLRKNYNLVNYIWVSERQKNGTLHFHMLTNNYMPILQINRAMAIIINNQVRENKMHWGNCSLDRYNGIDVDSIYASKRHRNSGKAFNPTQVRQWLSIYVTKYVTKNNEKFQHLCWHCSRSVSQLFTTTLLPLELSYSITSYLPTLRELYIHLVSDFNNTWIFKFEPPPDIYEKIFLYNDLIFGEFVPEKYVSNPLINYKTSAL